MARLPSLNVAMSFDQACNAVVAYLKEAVPLGYWSVSRYDGTDQLYLAVSDDAYGTERGDSHPWSDSLCRLMVSDDRPRIAPDVAAIPEYASAPISQALNIGAYIGIPIMRANGEMFGTICGLDPARQEDKIHEQRDLLELLSSLLAAVLDADMLRVEGSRERERLELAAETDELTGLFNRRGWERLLSLEEDRYQRFGDPGSIVILDLDGLKTINDTHGHAAGDRHLRLAAQSLRNATRDSDMIARLGGDEFGVLAAKTTPEQTRGLVERLRRILSDSGVEGSFGYAHYMIKGRFPAVWAAADESMYAEKSRRRPT